MANSSDAFHVDTTQITSLAEHLKGPRVRTIIGKAMIDAGQRSGRIARDNANKRIGNKSGNSSGRLAGSAVVIGTDQQGTTFTTDVVWNAKSNAGFPYAYVHEHGRGPVFAKPGKWLRFVSQGEVYFRKSVGPAAGTHYAERGLNQSRPQIQAEHDRAARTIVQKVEAL